MFHKLLWSKKTFLKLVFYIQFTTKEKTCKFNSCFTHKKSGNNFFAFPSDAGYANVISNVGVHAGKNRP